MSNSYLFHSNNFGSSASPFIFSYTYCDKQESLWHVLLLLSKRCQLCTMSVYTSTLEVIDASLPHNSYRQSIRATFDKSVIRHPVIVCDVPIAVKMLLTGSMELYRHKVAFMATGNDNTNERTIQTLKLYNNPMCISQYRVHIHIPRCIHNFDNTTETIIQQKMYNTFRCISRCRA